jgi:hypothetical protein
MNEKLDPDPGSVEASPGQSRNHSKLENHHGSCENYVDISAMIRSLQRAEGHTDCFRQDIDPCEEIECAWRIYCVEENSGLGKK